MPEYLLEIDAYFSGSVTTLRYSASGYTTKPSDTPASMFYEARIENPGSVSRALFAEGKTLGLGYISVGSIELSNTDGGLDALLGYGIDGRLVRVLSLSSASAAYSSATVVLRGTADRIDGDAASKTLRLRFYDRMLELDEPLQTSRYGGTTTSSGISGHLADGTADMKDQPKPLCCGAVKNVTPIPVNPFDLIYQVHDGAVSAITVYDGQVPLTLVSDYATVALLQAATIVAGKYGTCLASGLFRIGVETAFALTADVTEGATLSVRNASQVVQRMLAKMGLSGGGNIDATSFAAFATAAAQEVGIFINDDSNGSSAIGRILASVGGYITPMATGPFQAGIAPVIGSSAWNIDQTTLIGDEIGIVANPDTDKGLPAWRVVLRYGKSFTVLELAAIAPGASSARRGYVRREYRRVKDDDSSVLTTWLLAPELTIDTLLTSSADAATEVARRGDLYSVARQVVQAVLATSDADAMVLASTGTVTLARFGWNSGKLFVVVGREDDFGAGRTTLTLWG